jgi:hypothetical protein
MTATASVDDDGRDNGGLLDVPRPNRRRTAYKDLPSRRTDPRNNINNGRNRNFDGGRNTIKSTSFRTSDFSSRNFNGQIVKQETAQDLLGLLASKRGALSSRAGGGSLSMVNFATSVHRIAKHLSNFATRDHPGNQRGRVLSDPRFALLVCGIAEMLLDRTTGDGQDRSSNGEGGITEKERFGSRELSNVVWAIAKLQIVPPHSVIPVSLEDAHERLKVKAEQVRSSIFDIAKQRASGGNIGGPSSAAPSSSSWIPALSELCGILMDAMSFKALALDPKQFQLQELSNFIWAITAAERPTEDVVGFVVETMILAVSRAKADVQFVPQDFSITLWCLAKTGFTSGHDEKILPFVKNMMDNEPGFLDRFKPQELSNSVWAAAKILSQRQEEPRGPASDAALGICRHAARELIKRGGGSYRSQELSNTVWAMATVGFGVKSDASSAVTHERRQYTYIPSDDPEGDRSLMEQSVSIVMQNMKENLKPYTTQELNTVCWAQARLSQRDDELLEMIGGQLSNPRRKASPQDLSTSLWSMATIGYANKDVYRSIASRIAEIGEAGSKPQEYSNTLWALATADVIPKYVHAFDDTLLPDSVRPPMKEAMSDAVTACFAAGASEVIRRPEEFKPQEIKDVLWSFCRLGIRHPTLFQAAAEHLVGKGEDPKMGGRGLNAFNGQSISNLAYAYAKHSQIGSEVLELFGQVCRLPAAAGRLGCLTVSLLDVGEGLLRKLFMEIVKVDLETHGRSSIPSRQRPQSGDSTVISHL